MKTLAKIVAGLVVATLVVLFGLRVRDARRARAEQQVGGPDAAPPPVETGKVVRRDLVDRVTVTGNLQPRVSVDVFPEIGGRILTLEFEVGHPIEAGKPMATIEHDELTWQSKQATAQERSARAGVEQARVAAEGARTSYERAKKLHEKDVLPKAELEKAELAMKAADAALKTAQSQVGVAAAAANLMTTNVDNAVVKAPIGGTVIRRLVDIGAQVSPMAPIATIQDVAVLELEAAVPAVDYVKLHVGDAAAVSFDEWPGVVFPGTISTLAPVLDPQTRRAPVQIQIDNADGRLLTNMFAHVSIAVGERKGVVVVPARAVLALPGGKVVYVVSNGLAKKVTPRLGGTDGDWVVVEEGLAEGDVVVVAGQDQLVDGGAVTVAGVTP